MNGVLGAALALALTTQSGGPTIPLVIRGETVIMEKSAAEVMYVELQARQIKFGLSEDERHKLAAVEIALGTSPSTSTTTGAEDLTPAQREHFRWLRLPLQRARGN